MSSSQAQFTLSPLVEAGARLGCPQRPLEGPGRIHSVALRGKQTHTGSATTEGSQLGRDIVGLWTGLLIWMTTGAIARDGAAAREMEASGSIRSSDGARRYVSLRVLSSRAEQG